MESFLEYLQLAGHGGAVLLVWLLCLAGLGLSCVSISGTWLVLVAAGIAAWIYRPGFPGIWTLVFFLVLSVLIEGAEALAGAWGVKKRGGSNWAGFAALVGGLAGLFLGALIPIFLIGPLIGMLIGSFGLAFAVEHHRLKKVEHAAHIAIGAVIARLLIILLKVGVTLGMAAYLLIGITV